MIEFRLEIPTAISVGQGVFMTLGEETAEIGSKALLVTGRSSAHKFGLIKQVDKMFSEAGVEYVLFDKVQPNPLHSTCDEGAELARSSGCDVVVALGGGSAMDTAKAIAASAKTNVSCWKFTNHIDGREEIADALPIVAVPTTAATGSEANAGAVITHAESLEKCVMMSNHVIPKVAVCDPELHLTVPPWVTADGCVDILSHLLESYLSGEKDCGLQDRISEALINVVLDWGPVAFSDGKNIRARRELMYASTLALTGLPNRGREGAWPIHAIEHSLSGHYDISHGRGLAILLPRVMSYILIAIPERLKQLGERCLQVEGTDKFKTAEETVAKFVRWLSDIGQNQTLEDVGIDESKFEVMAEDVLRNYGDGRRLDYVVELNKRSIVEILKLCQRSNLSI